MIYKNIPPAQLFFIFLVSILIANFFILRPTLAQTNHIVINEIQIGGETSKDEFIEIFNPTNSPINLNGWRLSKQTASGNQSNLLTTFPPTALQPNAYFLITHPTDYTGEATADVVYSTQGSMAANNTLILFSDAGQTIVDLVGWGEVLTAENAPANNPPHKQSLERKLNNGETIDTDNNANDFFLNLEPTPSNQATSPANTPPPTSAPPQNTLPSPSTNPSSSQNTNYDPTPGDILINEFMPDPVNEGEEWIELINKTDVEINLENWFIQDGSNKKTALNGIISNLNGQNFLVIENPKGNLNNGGDQITLFSPTGKIINTITYGDWNDGNINDNAPTANDPMSVARINNTTEFSVTTTPTKGYANVITAEAENNSVTVNKNEALIISELFPNPVGSDREEFIELLNTSSSTIDATGWRLEDASGQSYAIRPSDLPTLIPSNEYLLIPRSLSAIALNNKNGETLQLFSPDKKRAVSSVSYNIDPEDGTSYIYIDKNWQWTTTPTPGNANILVFPNRSPLPTIYWPATGQPGETLTFSAEDTIDPDNDPILFNWSLGDGSTAEGEILTYSYNAPGNYEAKIEISDNKNEKITLHHTISIVDTVASKTKNGKVLGLESNILEDIVINEILPRPFSGEDEWIEIFNNNDADVNLGGWQLGDDSGKIFTLRPETTVEAFGYILLSKPQTKISLNDNGDTVFLISPRGEIVDKVSYSLADIGDSLARDEIKNNEWSWTTRPTPARLNIIIKPYPPLTQTQKFSGMVTIQGTVASIPGEIGPQTFYLNRITTPGAPKNLRIDLAENIITELKRNEIIEISGKIRNIQGEKRLQADSEGMFIFDNDANILTPTPLATVSPIDDLGLLVNAKGVISKGIRGGFILELENNQTIRIILPDSFTTKRPYPTGTEVKITGFLSRTNAGERILIRNKNDLTTIIPPAITLPTPTLPPVRWYQSYLFVTLLGILVFMLIIFYRFRQRVTPASFNIIDEEDTV